MSYTSENKLPRSVTLPKVKEIIELLGYKKVRSGLKIKSHVGSYFWLDNVDYRSWYGVELDVYKNKSGIIVGTRSTVSRSYWDLEHQNKTIRTLRDIFGGNFQTDAGRGRYFHPDGPPPSPLQSGCYLARWRFHNAMIKARVYLQSRELGGTIARETPSGFHFMDEMNPRLLSNNLLIPYVIAIWEEYFRATFTAALIYASARESVLKKARLGHAQLEQIAANVQPVERTIAECFSFQQPRSISENFKLLDSKLDLGGAMRKPYKRRRSSLFESIESLVENRNAFVHAGEMDFDLYDKKLQNVFEDIVAAIDRCYDQLGSHYDFIPIRNY